MLAPGLDSAEHLNMCLILNGLLVEPFVNTFRMEKCVCAKALSSYGEGKQMLVWKLFFALVSFSLRRNSDFAAATLVA